MDNINSSLILKFNPLFYIERNHTGNYSRNVDFAVEFEDLDITGIDNDKIKDNSYYANNQTIDLSNYPKDLTILSDATHKSGHRTMYHEKSNNLGGNKMTMNFLAVSREK